MRTYIFVGTIVVLCGVFVWVAFNKSWLPKEMPIACTMDAMICPDGSAVGRTGPNCEFAPCAKVETPAPTDDLIIIDTPTPNQEVTSAITISGKARGNWFFEASFPIVVVNWDGLIIGQGIATAQDEWMTTEFVPFLAVVSYALPPDTPYNRGALILKKDNPSGLPEHDDSREIPITFEMPQP